MDLAVGVSVVTGLGVGSSEISRVAPRRRGTIMLVLGDSAADGHAALHVLGNAVRVFLGGPPL